MRFTFKDNFFSYLEEEAPKADVGVVTTNEVWLIKKGSVIEFGKMAQPR